MNPDTYRIGVNVKIFETGKKEVGDSKISGYLWTGPMSSDLSLTGKQRSEENNTKINYILFPFYIWSQFFRPEENVLLRRFDYQPSYNLFGSLYVSESCPPTPSLSQH